MSGHDADARTPRIAAEITRYLRAHFITAVDQPRPLTEPEADLRGAIETGGCCRAYAFTTAITYDGIRVDFLVTDDDDADLDTFGPYTIGAYEPDAFDTGPLVDEAGVPMHRLAEVAEVLHGIAAREISEAPRPPAGAPCPGALEPPAAEAEMYGEPRYRCRRCHVWTRNARHLPEEPLVAPHVAAYDDDSAAEADTTEEAT